MGNLTVLLKKIPALGLAIGAFIVGGAGYLMWSHVPSKALAAQPSLDMFASSAPSSSFAFTLDGNWDGSALTGMKGANINVHADGKSNVHDTKDSGITATIKLTLAMNGINLVTANGDLRTLGAKAYLRVNDIASPMQLQAITGKWFVSDGSNSGAPSVSIEQLQQSTMNKNMFRLAEDLGTERLDGVDIRNVRVTLDQAAMTEAMKNGNASLGALGKQTASDADVKKFADAIGAGKLVLGIDAQGKLHRAMFTLPNDSGNPDSIVLRVFDHDKPVSIDEPTGALPFAQIMSLIKL